MYFVYRYMRGNKWIYVGKAKASRINDELMHRIRDHAHDERFKEYANCKIQYAVFLNESDMIAVESMLIKTQKPVLNLVGQTDDVLPFVFDDKLIKWFDVNYTTTIYQSDVNRSKKSARRYKARMPDEYGGGWITGYSWQDVVNKAITKAVKYQAGSSGFSF